MSFVYWKVKFKFTFKVKFTDVEKRIWTDKYVHEHDAYDKNDAGYVNVGSFPL